MSSNITSVTVRMYHTGSVGDCLLLLFNKGKTVSYKMLIDCGGWNADTASITACAEDIKDVTGGQLDLLVVTHQHEDHVSGFNQARSVFDQIAAKEVWMSWIEDDTDSVGIILKEKFGKKLKELKAIAAKAVHQMKLQERSQSTVRGFNARLGARRAAMEDTIQLIEFEEGTLHSKGLAAGKRTNDDAMRYVKSKGKVKFRKPGEVIADIAGAEGCKFFILGPPRDEDLSYFKIDMEDDEMYHLAAAAGKKQQRSPKNPILSAGIKLEDGVSPFGDMYQLKNADKTAFTKLYTSEDYKWRQIENDWLESASAIALRVTNLTNNTSLAMAIEIGDKVILLPGDGQSGNWMGWHKEDVKKALKNKGGKDTEALLKSTVLYKVGHHGSHNGTASKSGLDLMESEHLVAMMPLVQDKIPSVWGGSKNFPAKALYGKLIEKTRGRLIRTDEGMVTDATAKKLRSQLSASAKNQFEKNFVQGSCWVQYTVKV